MPQAIALVCRLTSSCCGSYQLVTRSYRVKTLTTLSQCDDVFPSSVSFLICWLCISFISSFNHLLLLHIVPAITHYAIYFLLCKVAFVFHIYKLKQWSRNKQCNHYYERLRFISPSDSSTCSLFKKKIQFEKNWLRHNQHNFNNFKNMT